MSEMADLLLFYSKYMSVLSLVLYVHVCTCIISTCLYLYSIRVLPILVRGGRVQPGKFHGQPPLTFQKIEDFGVLIESFEVFKHVLAVN